MMSQQIPNKQLLTWPLIQQLYTRRDLQPSTNQGFVLPDARLMNAYAEEVPGQKAFWVFKRPGVGAPIFLPTSSQNGGTYSYNQPNTQGGSLVFSVAGGKLYANGAPVAGFAGIAGAPCYFETINSNPPTVYIQVAGSAVAGTYNGPGYLYNTSTATLTQITDTNYVGFNKVPGIAFLDDWTFVMDINGIIWNTQNQSDASVWSALNSIPATNYGDQGVFLARQLEYVIAMKQWSTQVFFDAGAQVNGQGSPLGIVPDALIPYGCLHPFTVAKIDETLIWVSSNQNLQPQVIVLDNLTPTIVSSPSVERILKQFLSLTGYTVHGGFGVYSTDINAWGIKIAGHRLYGLTIAQLNVTLVFDLDQKIWSFWTDQYGNYWPYKFPTYQLANFTLSTPGTLYMQGPTGGLYPVDDMYTYPTDNGAVFPVDIYTPMTDFGTLRTKTLNMMYFESDEIKGNAMMLRASDNDFNSWSNFRIVDLGYIEPQLEDEGSFIRRAYHIRHQLPAPFRIKSTGLDMDIGIL